MSDKKNTIRGSYKFSDIDYDILSNIAKFELQADWTIFEEWFNYKYEIEPDALKWLKKLIETHKYNMQNYTERQLQAQFINPFLSIVNFNTDKFKSWFEYELTGIVNNCKLTGYPDFMVAPGNIKPEKPFFFFQEFKKSRTNSHPDFQVLAAMSVAIEKNNLNLMHGVYNIGRLWYFLILKKLDTGKYQYFQSDVFDSLKINDLKQIFVNLQAVKHKYCK